MEREKNRGQKIIQRKKSKKNEKFHKNVYRNCNVIQVPATQVSGVFVARRLSVALYVYIHANVEESARVVCECMCATFDGRGPECVYCRYIYVCV